MMVSSSELPKSALHSAYNEVILLYSELLRRFVILWSFFFNFTIARLWLVALRLPCYLAIAFARSILLHGLLMFPLLCTTDGRRQLEAMGKANRRHRDAQAQAQFNGEYRFDENALRASRSASSTVGGAKRLLENGKREYFEACPALRTAVVSAGPRDGQKVVLLHGNPSWSFMYRNVIPVLADHGFEVFAVDWVGFGMSDKPLVAEQISFELHMRTLMRVLEEFDLRHTHILAHDWGGCVALSTIPHLDHDRVDSLVLLNSFFPPRLSDISLNCSLLYAVWLCCQGIFDGLLPESLIIQYMAPSVSLSAKNGYSLPFSSRKEKKAVQRFTYLVPGMPNSVYRLFQSKVGLVMDGICPWQSFSSLHEQDRLRKRDKSIRDYWAAENSNVKVAVVFGRNDPLLRIYWRVLVDGIKTGRGRAEGVWVEGAGHYAVEEKAEEIAKRFIGFVEKGSLF